MTSDLKRLRFAQNSWIDVERCGGDIVGGTADEWVNLARIDWSSVEIGKPVKVYPFAAHADSGRRKKAIAVYTRPLESMEVLT